MAKTSNYLFKLDLMILSLLKEKDQYAYELTKEIAEKSKGRIEPKNGTMYPILLSTNSLKTAIFQATQSSTTIKLECIIT